MFADDDQWIVGTGGRRGNAVEAVQWTSGETQSIARVDDRAGFRSNVTTPWLLWVMLLIQFRFNLGETADVILHAVRPHAASLAIASDGRGAAADMNGVFSLGPQVAV